MFDSIDTVFSIFVKLLRAFLDRCDLLSVNCKLTFFFFNVEKILHKISGLPVANREVSDSYRLKLPRWSASCNIWGSSGTVNYFGASRYMCLFDFRSVFFIRLIVSILGSILGPYPATLHLLNSCFLSYFGFIIFRSFLTVDMCCIFPLSRDVVSSDAAASPSLCVPP